MANDAKVEQLEDALTAARKHHDIAGRAVVRKHTPEELKTYLAASEAVLVAERALAAARGEAHAIPFDFPVKWDTGAPLPHLLKNDHLAFLIFYVSDRDPNWDGTYIDVRQPGSTAASRLAIAEFKGCHAAMLGTPNDEVFHGHSLHGKGLVGYRPLLVENSAWIRELERINSVHSYYLPEGWRTLKHYIFGFHDSTFECVARSVEVERVEMSLPDALNLVCRKLVE